MSENLPVGTAPEGSGDGRPADMLVLMGQVAGAVASGTLLASVLYDWAYFRVFYPHLTQFLSLNDHITNALEWLPLAALSAGAGLVWGALQTSYWPPPESASATFKWVVVLPNWGLAILASLLLLLLTTPENLGSVLLTLWAIAFPITSWVVRRLVPHSLSRSLSGGLFLSVFVLCLGSSAGVGDLISDVGTSRVVLTSGSEIDKVRVIRSIERGLLIRQVEDNQVMFLPWKAVEKIYVVKVSLEPRTRECLWFGWRCDLRPLAVERSAVE